MGNTLYEFMVDFFAYLLDHYTGRILTENDIRTLHKLGLPLRSMTWTRPTQSKFANKVDGDLLECVGSNTPVTAENLAEAFLHRYITSVDEVNSKKFETPYYSQNRITRCQNAFNKFARKFIMHQLLAGNHNAEIELLSQRAWSYEILEKPVIERKYAKFSYSTFFTHQQDKKLTFMDKLDLDYLVGRVIKDSYEVRYEPRPEKDEKNEFDLFSNPDSI